MTSDDVDVIDNASQSAIAFHNIAELDDASGYPGTLLRRWPRQVSEAMLRGHVVAAELSLSEIRFVLETGQRVALALTSLRNTDLFIYYGDFLYTHVQLLAGQLTRVPVEQPANIDQMQIRHRRFAPGVWRLCLEGQILFHGVETLGATLRAPYPCEEPSLRWLAYGSSITHGYTPVSRQQCYVAQAADHLCVDVLNLGLAGSCLAEPVVAEHIASRGDWDFATFELGVNMRDDLEPEAFEQRVRCFIDHLCEHVPGRPLVLISPFTTAIDLLPEIDETAARNTQAYRTILACIAKDHASHGVHLIDGRDVLDDPSGLTCDLIHPSTEGHTRMAIALAALLSPLLPRDARRIQSHDTNPCGLPSTPSTTNRYGQRNE